MQFYLAQLEGPVDEQDQPKWKDAERNAILGFRKAFSLNINLRPATVYPELSNLSPLKKEIIEQGVDILVVRELLNGIYFGEHSTEGNSAKDTMNYSTDQIKPIIEFACYAASERRKKVTIVDKANVLDCSRLWRKVAEEVVANHQEIELEFMYIDNAIMQVIKNPSQFDVVATSNLFGDIFSDATSVLPGSLGLMPSASLGGSVHMYEPIGGSAPDIAGKGIANPIAQILSAALMLRFTFDLEEEAQAIEHAVSSVLTQGHRTGDIGGGTESVSTEQMGDLIASQI